MSGNENEGSRPSDYIPVPSRMQKIVSNWSISNLDKIINALERYLVFVNFSFRDNMQSSDELHQLIPDMKAEEVYLLYYLVTYIKIDQLINFCVSSNDADFPSDITLDPVDFEESSLDVRCLIHFYTDFSGSKE